MSQISRNRLMRSVVAAAAAATFSFAFAGSAAYLYDSLGRLTRVTYSNGTVINYSYDAAGNRSQTIVTGAP